MDVVANLKKYKSNTIFKAFITLTVLSIPLSIFIRKKVKKYHKNKYFEYKIKAKKFYNDGDPYSAMTYAKKCINEDTKNVNGYIILIKSLLQTYDYDNAEKYLKYIKPLCNAKQNKKEYTKLIKRLKYEKNELKKHPDLDYTNKFMNYLYKNGAKIKKSRIGYNENNIRGAIATEPIKKNEIIARIPLNILFTQYEAKQYLLNKYKRELNLSDEKITKTFSSMHYGENILLSLYLLENKSEKAQKMLEFINKCDISSLPIFNKKYNWMLKNTAIEHQIDLKDKKIIEDIDKINELIPSKKYDKEQLKLLIYNVNTRTFGAKKIKKSENETILAPFIDMQNHNNTVSNYITWGYNDTTETFYLQSNGYIAEYEEIFTSYGTKQNSLLYYLYGFTEKNNTRKSVILEFNEKPYKCIEVFEHQKSLAPYLFDAIEDQVKKERKKIKNKEQLEIYKLEKFIRLCEDKLKKYVVNPTQYMKEKGEKNLSFQEYNCLNIISDEISLLNQYITSSKKCINYIKKHKFDKLKNYINTDNTLDDLSREYIEYIIKHKIN